MCLATGSTALSSSPWHVAPTRCQPPTRACVPDHARPLLTSPLSNRDRWVSSCSSRASTSLFSAAASSLGRGASPDSKLDSPASEAARRGVLSESFFPAWKDDSSSSKMDSPETMQKKDPLGIQIWKLYARTKSQLPNKERMDNLSWRMMSMNMKMKHQQQNSTLVPDQQRRNKCVDYLFVPPNHSH